MPSIGPLEMMMVAVIALIVFGPQRLPEIARSVGKAIAEFKRQASDIRTEFQSGLDVDEPEDEKPAPAPDTGPSTPPADTGPSTPPADTGPSTPTTPPPA